jgi:CubicO group peptidase (beta-lactamase class C family)
MDPPDMKPCLVAASLLTLSFPSLSAAGPAATRIRDLEALIPRLMREGDVPGLSIVLIGDSKVVWHRAYGFANAGTRAPLNDRSVFESASLTKPVFAYAVLKLVDTGVMSLDAPLGEPPGGPVTDERMKTITARMVLEHTTGFQNEVMPGETLALHFMPGERFSYSGAGFLYLQRFVERATGKPLSALMDELVFRPLGMRSSGYTWRTEYERLEVFGHNAAGLPAPRRKPTKATVATLHTTALDYARFVMAVMKGAGLRAETARAMLTPEVRIDEGCFTCLAGGTGRMSASLSWGLGWGLERTARGTAFWHHGENNGEFQNFAMGLPDGDGIVVFTNSGNGFSIMPAIVTAALGGSHPAFAWMGYDTYDSPSRTLLRDILGRGPVALEGRAAAEIPERRINEIGYVLLQKKRPADAVAVFELNVRRFPESWNAHDSLGEAYAATGERQKAIASYQRSLELNPRNANATAMLEKLRRP